MKDFYDIYFLSESNSFEGPKLQKAVQETFARRETDIPAQVPIALTCDFFEDETKVKQWNAFLSKISDNRVPKDHLKVVNRLKKFLWPVAEASNSGRIIQRDWLKGKKWE